MTGGIVSAQDSGCVPRIATPISLNPPERLELERWVNAHGTPQQVTQRCRIVLAASEGRQDKQIAEDLQINFKSAALWRARFLKEGSDCLWEVAAGRGRKPTYPAGKVTAIIDATLQNQARRCDALELSHHGQST